MSLINEYLQKTIPQSQEDRGVLVPPILRRKSRKALSEKLRFIKPLSKIIILFVFFLTGYIFYESFNYLKNHKTDLSNINTKSVKTVVAADSLKEQAKQKLDASHYYSSLLRSYFHTPIVNLVYH